MIDKYKTCIILINYNSIEDTIDCLKSLLLVSGELPFVVLVDNASIDVDEIGQKVAFYPHLKLIKKNVNIGFGRANNVGIEWAFSNLNCNYIFILNNDTVVQKDAISLLENASIASSPDVALLTPKILVNDNHNEVWYEGAEISFKKVTPISTVNNVNGYTRFASGCAMFFKYDSLKKLKGFDPFFFMYDEDVELSLRVCQEGMKIQYVSESIIYHKCQGSQTKEKNIPSNQLDPYHPNLIFYLKNTIPNRKYIIKRYLLGTDRIISNLNHSVYWLLKCFQYILFGKTKAAYNVIKYLIFLN